MYDTITLQLQYYNTAKKITQISNEPLRRSAFSGFWWLRCIIDAGSEQR